MNFEDDEDDPHVYKNPQLRARFEELNQIVLRNLPTIQNVDESDISDEPVRRLTEAELRASCTSLFSSLNLSASGSRENKPEKKEVDNGNTINNSDNDDGGCCSSKSREPFFDVPDNLDEILDATYGTNFTKKKNKQNVEAKASLLLTMPPVEENDNNIETDENFNLASEGAVANGDGKPKKEARPKLKSEPQLKTLEECVAAQGDGHQCGPSRDEVVFAQLTKMVSATCGEHLNPVTGEGIVLEEGDCGNRKLATASGSRPEVSDASWKRGSASTSNCGRPATVPKARPRRSETVSVMTNTECDSRELVNDSSKAGKTNDEDSDSDDDDSAWWEEQGEAGATPKKREVVDKGSNVDITRQRSILDLCSVEHGETVIVQSNTSTNVDRQECSLTAARSTDEDQSKLDQMEESSANGTSKPDDERAMPITLTNGCCSSEQEVDDCGITTLNTLGTGSNAATGGEQSVDTIDASFDEDSDVVYDGLEQDRGEAWDWVSAIPRACFMEEMEMQRDSYLPLLCSVRDGDIDQRLLQQRLQVSRDNWN